jgi:feruloyl esterase
MLDRDRRNPGRSLLWEPLRPVIAGYHHHGCRAVLGGTYTAPDGQVFPNMPAFCRVAATSTPTSDSNIKVEVWMPFSGWNGRYLGTGNGNIGGLIQYGPLGGILSFAPYAVANTDLGTSPAATDQLGSRVLTGHPEKQIDYATRSTHLMTVRAKQIIRAFYGEKPRFSYFSGCSVGGGQGIHEALQFPGDYDGIVAGAPLIDSTHNSALRTWNWAAFHPDAEGKTIDVELADRKSVGITADQETVITAAVVKQCAGKDGSLSSDKFLTDPRDCRWDPAALQCRGNAADARTCLTGPQVVAMRLYYQGPINPHTGERIFVGQVRGSESNGRGGPADTAARLQPDSGVPYWAFGNDWDWSAFDFDHDQDAIDKALAARLNANTADLEEFKSRGGKLILFHGFADPRVATLNTIAYYERLITSQIRGGEHDRRERKEGRHDKAERKESLRRTQEFARLFLQPGVGHCGGGAGPDRFEGRDRFDARIYAPFPQQAMEAWVEHGMAPEQLIAAKVTNGAPVFTRPLCPYPALPRYSGTGDPTSAANFRCIADNDGDDNQPPAPRYLDDGDNYPIVPIEDQYGRQHR